MKSQFLGASIFLISLSLCIDWEQWLTTDMMFDGFNTILVATSAVSVWAPVAVADVLNNCWKNEENRPFPNQINNAQDALKKLRATWISNVNCAKAVGRQVGALALGIAGLRYIAGMNKHEEHDVISL